MNVGPQGPGPYNPPKSSNTAIVIGVIAAAGCLMVVIIGILAAIMFPVFARSRAKAQAASCMSNVHQLSVAMLAYQSSWDSTTVSAGNWNASIQPFVKISTAWNCPADQSGQPSYAMNAKMAGIREAEVLSPPDTVMIFESDPGDNKAGGAELLPSEPRHAGMHTIGYADGHIGGVHQSAAGALGWDPKKPVPGASQPARRKVY